MSTHPRPHADRDELSPVDAALGGAIARAGQDLQDVPADLARDHLAAITSLAAAHAHPAPAPTPAPAPGWRTRLRRVAGLTAFKVAVGAGVAVAGTTGGLAATGHLPAPVQQVVSDGAGWFGLDVPAPTTEAGEPPDGEDDRRAPVEDADAVPPDGESHEGDRLPLFVPAPPADGDRPGEADPEPEPDQAPPVDPGSDRAPADPGSNPDPDPAPDGDQPEPPAPDRDPAPPAPAAGDEPGGGAPPAPPGGNTQQDTGEQADGRQEPSGDAGQHQAAGDPGASDDEGRPAAR